jgi:hypothetical protein
VQLLHAGEADRYLYDGENSTTYKSEYIKRDKSAAEQCITAGGQIRKDGWRWVTVFKLGDMLGDVRLI